MSELMRRVLLLLLLATLEGSILRTSPLTREAQAPTSALQAFLRRHGGRLAGSGALACFGVGTGSLSHLGTGNGLQAVDPTGPGESLLLGEEDEVTRDRASPRPPRQATAIPQVLLGRPPGAHCLCPGVTGSPSPPQSKPGPPSRQAARRAAARRLGVRRLGPVLHESGAKCEGCCPRAWRAATATRLGASALTTGHHDQVTPAADLSFRFPPLPPPSQEKEKAQARRFWKKKIVPGILYL